MARDERLLMVALFGLGLCALGASTARAQDTTMQNPSTQNETSSGPTSDTSPPLNAPPPVTGPVQREAAPQMPSAEDTSGDTASGITIAAGTDASVTFSGYVEAFYQWNFNDPSNGITNLRGFDNRHNTFTLSNVVLDAAWRVKDVVYGRLALQFGHTGETYYLAEPVSGGASLGAAANDSSKDVWKYIQQANVGVHLTDTFLVEAGIFLSPIGIEGMAVKDQGNWSRSNLFFGLPFYHTGVRAAYSVSDEIALTLAVYNGWNSVVDNNAAKSVSLQLGGKVSDEVAFSVLYLGGIERTDADPAGAYWRSQLDSWWSFTLSDRVSLAIHGNVGLEPSRFGSTMWAAGAVYGRFGLTDWLFLAARADAFYEARGNDSTGTAGAIFWPTRWMASQTLTLDARPHDNVSIRLEYRHDQACAPTATNGCGNAFYRGDVATNMTTGAFLADASSQDTVTVGMTTWF